MSNGPYGQQTCRCGTVVLLMCGAPLARGRDAAGEPVTLWPLEAVQIGQGADELAADSEGRAQACRRCGEVLLVEHAEAGVGALPAEVSEEEPEVSSLERASRQRLEALGYRLSG